MIEQESGIVFDIQRFSVHDGPGIRTLVFLKGCTLRCNWCSNPESQLFKPQLFFQMENCIGCMACVEKCPEKAIKVEGKKLSFQRSLCLDCGECIDVCYAEARVMKGYPMDSEEVVEEVLKDEAFYSNSGGGITLGGGEPLFQADFARTILKGCKEKGINTAIETAGNVSWQKMKKVVSYTDLFLYDIKHLDPGKHEEYTGVDNRLILDNLDKLMAENKEIIIRTPVIPGFNDTVKEIDAIAEYVANLGIGELHLLPYHRFGENKYAFLGREYPLKGAKELTDELIEELKEAASRKGLRVKVGG